MRVGFASTNDTGNPSPSVKHDDINGRWSSKPDSSVVMEFSDTKMRILCCISKQNESLYRDSKKEARFFITRAPSKWRQSKGVLNSAELSRKLFLPSRDCRRLREGNGRHAVGCFSYLKPWAACIWLLFLVEASCAHQAWVNDGCRGFPGPTRPECQARLLRLKAFRLWEHPLPAPENWFLVLVTSMINRPSCLCLSFIRICINDKKVMRNTISHP